MKSMLVAVQSVMEQQMAETVIAESGFAADVLLLEPQTAVSEIRKYFGGSTGVVITYGQLADSCMNAGIEPLVNVSFRGQDMANLMAEVIRRIGEFQGGIALIGTTRLFRELVPLSGLLTVPVFRYVVTTPQERRQAVQSALTEKVSVVVGDARICQAADELGLPSICLTLSRDSFLSALQMASQITETWLQAQRNSQEMNMLLQHTADAIIRLNNEGTILYANPRAEQAIAAEESLYGCKLVEVSSLVNASALIRALEVRRPEYVTVLQFGNASYVATISAISFEGKPDGFILSMQEFADIEDMDERICQERSRRGFIASNTFDTFPNRSPKMRALLEDAETYAQYDVPLLLTGEPRLPKTRLAECIHNASLRRNNSFVHVDLSTISPERQYEVLFGRARGMDTGLVSMANRGTLFLLDVHMLAKDCQGQLLSILRNGHFQRRDSAEPVPVDVRLICSTFYDLMDLVREDQFMWQLASTLLGLALPLPPIREIPEDIPAFLSDYMKLASKKFKKNVRFTDEAMEHLCRYPWPANLRDIEYFSMKAIMLAPEPEIGLDFVREKLLPDLEEGEQVQQVHIVANQEELAIRRVLRETGNNRNLAAEQLGISRATLWRKMNKYNIQ